MSDDIQLTAESFTVHAREKVSTGDYENAEYHVTIEGNVDAGEVIMPADEEESLAAHLTPDTRKELKARLLSVQKESQAVVERACENRVKEPGHEDWGVHNGEADR